MIRCTKCIYRHLQICTTRRRQVEIGIKFPQIWRYQNRIATVDLYTHIARQNETKSHIAYISSQNNKSSTARAHVGHLHSVHKNKTQKRLLNAFRNTDECHNSHGDKRWKLPQFREKWRERMDNARFSPDLNTQRSRKKVNNVAIDASLRTGRQTISIVETMATLNENRHVARTIQPKYEPWTMPLYGRGK